MYFNQHELPLCWRKIGFTEKGFWLLEGHVGGRCKYISLLACTANVPICPACNYLREGKTEKTGVFSIFVFLLPRKSLHIKKKNEDVKMNVLHSWIKLHGFYCTLFLILVQIFLLEKHTGGCSSTHSYLSIVGLNQTCFVYPVFYLV